MYNQIGFGSLQINDRAEEDKPIWDIFRKDHFPEIPKCCEGFTDAFFRVFKVVFYVFLIVVGICGVGASRGGLQVLASILGDHDKKFSSVSPNFEMLTYENYLFQEIKIQNHSNLLEYFIPFVRKLLLISFSIQIFFPEDCYAGRHLLPFLLPNGCPRCIKVSAEHRSVLIWKHRETNMCSVCNGRCVWCGCHAVKRSIIHFSCCINKSMSCIKRNV